MLDNSPWPRNGQQRRGADLPIPTDRGHRTRGFPKPLQEQAISESICSKRVPNTSATGTSRTRSMMSERRSRRSWTRASSPLSPASNESLRTGGTLTSCDWRLSGFGGRGRGVRSRYRRNMEGFGSRRHEFPCVRGDTGYENIDNSEGEATGLRGKSHPLIPGLGGSAPPPRHSIPGFGGNLRPIPRHKPASPKVFGAVCLLYNPPQAIARFERVAVAHKTRYRASGEIARTLRANRQFF